MMENGKRPRMRRSGDTLTIADVARHAGVSPMTVSRVINGSENVRAATREKVEQSIRTLNYSPSAAARMLASARTMRIGLLFSNPSAGYLSEFLMGSLNSAGRNYAQLVLEKCEAADVEIVLRRMITSGIDGVLLPPPLCDMVGVHALVTDAGIPAVVVASGAPPASMPAINIDDEAAAFLMTEHLVQLGHRRIGFIAGHPNQTGSALRLKGFRRALKKHAISEIDAPVAQGFFTYRSGLDAAEQLLRTNPPSAIFASNDDMAAATVAVAHRMQLDVPGDLTVTGFDDLPLATTIWPELTTIRQPVAEMADQAVSMLVKAIHDRQDGKNAEALHVTLGHALIRRQSDAPPRRRPRASDGKAAD